MSSSTRKLHLGVILSGVNQAESQEPSVKLKGWLEHVKSLERNKLDFIHLEGDGGGLEPLQLLSALALTTERIGLSASVPVVYHEPYHIARKLASLDVQSRGRAAWRPDSEIPAIEAAHFGHLAVKTVSERNVVKEEFIEVVQGLLDSWEDDAIIVDTESDVYALREKVHYLDHQGTNYSVKGPLNIQRPPQGYPVLIREMREPETLGAAGFAKEAHTELVWTSHTDLQTAKAYYDDLKRLSEQVVGHVAGHAENIVVVMSKVSISNSGMSAGQWAERFEQWLAYDAADGFVLTSDDGDDSLIAFVEEIVPLLQAKGIFRSEYTGLTLRDYLGLPRPVSRYANATTAE